MVELLAVKSGDLYCRFIENSFELCAMNKASVYPLRELKSVKEKLCLVKDVHPDTLIIKMIITEEILMEEENEAGLK